MVAENTRRNDVEGGERARRGDIEAVHPYQVARQPKGKRDEGAEYEEVVKREAPDLKVAERLQLLSQGDGLARIAPASGSFRIVARGDQEQDGQDYQRCGPNMTKSLPDHRLHDVRREQG